MQFPIKYDGIYDVFILVILLEAVFKYGIFVRKGEKLFKEQNDAINRPVTKKKNDSLFPTPAFTRHLYRRVLASKFG